MIVLLLLGVIWAAVLIPPWLQSRREARPIASMRSFHRQLWLLERTSPDHAPGPHPLVSGSAVTVYGADDEAYDYDYGYPHGYGEPDGGGGAYAAVSGDGYAYAEDMARGAYAARAGEGYGYRDDEVDAGNGGFDDRVGPLVGVGAGASAAAAAAGMAGAAGAGGAGGASAGRRTSPWFGAAGADVRIDEQRWAELGAARRRRIEDERSPVEIRPRLEGYRRRRRVLAVLLVAALATVPPVVLVGGTASWVAQAAADTLVFAYVALLVRRQRRLLEREEKVHYLAPIGSPRSPVVVLHGGAAP